jgi:hypothetical protein
MVYTRIPVQITPFLDDGPANFYGAGNVTQQAVNRIKTQFRLALLEDGLEAADDAEFAATQARRRESCWST